MGGRSFLSSIFSFSEEEGGRFFPGGFEVQIEPSAARFLDPQPRRAQGGSCQALAVLEAEERLSKQLAGTTLPSAGLT